MALPLLRLYVQNADAASDEDEGEQILESRFVIAQMLEAIGHSDESRTELEAIRPLLADAFGPDSTHVHNLNKQLDRLGSSEAHG